MVDYTRDQILGFAEEMREKAIYSELLLKVSYGESVDAYLQEAITSNEDITDNYWQELGKLQSMADELLMDLEDYRAPDDSNAARFGKFPEDVRQTEFEQVQQIRNDVVMLVLRYHEKYDRELPDRWDPEIEDAENWEKWWKDDGEIIEDGDIIIG